MGKLIYLDHYRLQEPDLPPYSCCGGLVRRYVVDASVPPKTRPVIQRWKNWQDKELDSQACYVMRGSFWIEDQAESDGAERVRGLGDEYHKLGLMSLR